MLIINGNFSKNKTKRQNTNGVWFFKTNSIGHGEKNGTRQ
jgi:hypothetical protein